jgi:hypothetical protein
MLLKFGGMTRAELRSISYSEMERLQLVLMARAEAMLPQASSGGSIGSAVQGDDGDGMPSWMHPSASTN